MSAWPAKGESPALGATVTSTTVTEATTSLTEATTPLAGALAETVEPVVAGATEVVTSTTGALTQTIDGTLRQLSTELPPSAFASDTVSPLVANGSTTAARAGATLPKGPSGVSPPEALPLDLPASPAGSKDAASYASGTGHAFPQSHSPLSATSLAFGDDRTGGTAAPAPPGLPLLPQTNGLANPRGAHAAEARAPRPSLPVPTRAPPDGWVASGAGSVGSGALLLAALAVVILLVAPGSGRWLRPASASWPLPTPHLSLERPG